MSNPNFEEGKSYRCIQSPTKRYTIGKIYKARNRAGSLGILTDCGNHHYCNNGIMSEFELIEENKDYYILEVKLGDELECIKKAVYNNKIYGEIGDRYYYYGNGFIKSKKDTSILFNQHLFVADQILTTEFFKIIKNECQVQKPKLNSNIYCSCDYPKLIKNIANNSIFNVCINCKKESV